MTPDERKHHFEAVDLPAITAKVKAIPAKALTTLQSWHLWRAYNEAQEELAALHRCHDPLTALGIQETSIRALMEEREEAHSKANEYAAHEMHGEYGECIERAGVLEETLKSLYGVTCEDDEEELERVHVFIEGKPWLDFVRGEWQWEAPSVKKDEGEHNG